MALYGYVHAGVVAGYLSVYLSLVALYASTYITQHQNLFIASRCVDMLMADLVGHSFMVLMNGLNLIFQTQQRHFPCWLMKAALMDLAFVINMITTLRSMKLLWAFEKRWRWVLALGATAKRRLTVLGVSVCLAVVWVFTLSYAGACHFLCKGNPCPWASDWMACWPFGAIWIPVLESLAYALGKAGAHSEALGMRKEVAMGNQAVTVCMVSSTALCMALDSGWIGLGGERFRLVPNIIALTMAAVHFVITHVAPSIYLGYGPAPLLRVASVLLLLPNTMMMTTGTTASSSKVAPAPDQPGGGILTTSATTTSATTTTTDALGSTTRRSAHLGQQQHGGGGHPYAGQVVSRRMMMAAARSSSSGKLQTGTDRTTHAMTPSPASPATSSSPSLPSASASGSNDDGHEEPGTAAEGQTRRRTSSGGLIMAAAAAVAAAMMGGGGTSTIGGVGGEGGGWRGDERADAISEGDMQAFLLAVRQDDERRQHLLSCAQRLLCEDAMLFALGLSALRHETTAVPNRKHILEQCQLLLHAHFGNKQEAVYKVDVSTAAEQTATKEVNKLLRRKVLFADDLSTAIESFQPAMAELSLRLRQVAWEFLREEEMIMALVSPGQANNRQQRGSSVGREAAAGAAVVGARLGERAGGPRCG